MALKGPNKPEYAGSTANDFFFLILICGSWITATLKTCMVIKFWEMQEGLFDEKW